MKIAMVLLFMICSSFFITAQVSEQDVLKKTITKMDSIYFTAYNNCDLKTQGELYAEDFEFYHDQGGLSTSKEEVLESIKKNICGKVTRELVKGSIEVHAIPDFGAVAMGMHKFYNAEEPNAISKASKFITIWKLSGEHWQMSRIISLH